MYTGGAKDPDSPDQVYYLFVCHDITFGSSEEERVWKVEPKVAAQIFERFLLVNFDLTVMKVGHNYYFKVLQQKDPDPKGDVNS